MPIGQTPFCCIVLHRWTRMPTRSRVCSIVVSCMLDCFMSSIDGLGFVVSCSIDGVGCQHNREMAFTHPPDATHSSLNSPLLPCSRPPPPCPAPKRDLRCCFRWEVSGKMLCYCIRSLQPSTLNPRPSTLSLQSSTLSATVPLRLLTYYVIALCTSAYTRV